MSHPVAVAERTIISLMIPYTVIAWSPELCAS